MGGSLRGQRRQTPASLLRRDRGRQLPTRSDPPKGAIRFAIPRAGREVRVGVAQPGGVAGLRPSSAGVRVCAGSCPTRDRARVSPRRPSEERVARRAPRRSPPRAAVLGRRATRSRVVRGPLGPHRLGCHRTRHSPLAIRRSANRPRRSPSVLVSATSSAIRTAASSRSRVRERGPRECVARWNAARAWGASTELGPDWAGALRRRGLSRIGVSALAGRLPTSGCAAPQPFVSEPTSRGASDMSARTPSSSFATWRTMMRFDALIRTCWTRSKI